jgi:hypothetical protein
MSKEAPYTRVGCSVLVLEGIIIPHCSKHIYGQKEVHPAQAAQQLKTAVIVKKWQVGV